MDRDQNSLQGLPAQLKNKQNLSNSVTAESQHKEGGQLKDTPQLPIATDSSSLPISKVNQRIPKSLKPLKKPSKSDKDKQSEKVLSITEMANKQLQALQSSLPSSSTVLLGGTFNITNYLAPQAGEGVINPMRRFQFNQIASHNTPYNRPLRDVRSPL